MISEQIYELISLITLERAWLDNKRSTTSNQLKLDQLHHEYNGIPVLMLPVIAIVAAVNSVLAISAAVIEHQLMLSWVNYNKHYEVTKRRGPRNSLVKLEEIWESQS